MNKNEIGKKNQDYLKIVLIGIFVTFILFNLQGVISWLKSIINVLKPMLIGVGCAFVLHIPIMHLTSFIQSKAKKDGKLYNSAKSISTWIVLFAALIIIVLFLSYMAPKLIESIIDLFSNMNRNIRGCIKSIDSILVSLGINYRIEDIKSIQVLKTTDYEQSLEKIIPVIQNYIPAVVANSSGLLGAFSTGLSAFMFAMYMIGSSHTLIRQIKKVLVFIFGYDNAVYLAKIGHKANEIFTVFVSKRVLESVILCVIFYIGMRIFHFSYPELNTVLLFILSFIPIFGPMLANAIGCILIFAASPIHALYYLIYFQVVTNFESYVIYPRVVGDSIGVSGFYVLASITIFGAMFGMVGMFLAVPLAAIVQVVVSDIINDELHAKRILVTHETIRKLEEGEDDGYVDIL